MTVQAEESGDITFIIALYEDMVYSDGTPVTAWDYAFSFLLTMAPEMQELGASVHKPEYIVGYSNYINGKTNRLAGVRVLGDYLMHITIDDAYLPFFYELGLLDCTPYPISVIAPGVKVADDGASTFAMFAAGRAFEQVRNSIRSPSTRVLVRKWQNMACNTPGRSFRTSTTSI